MYKKIIGTARLDLIQQGVFVFEKYKRGMASGHVGGKFHRFLLAVFEYATGKEAETNARLESHLKPMLKAFRERREGDIELEKIWLALQAAKSMMPRDEARMKRLEAKFANKLESLGKIWSRFVPQMRD